MRAVEVDRPAFLCYIKKYRINLFLAGRIWKGRNDMADKTSQDQNKEVSQTEVSQEDASQDEALHYNEKYVAYVSTYTQGDSHGIKIYDVDMENGRFVEKDKVEITNSSYVTISHNGKFLYSITDFGVESYTIQADGNLEILNFAPINGMRGCYVSTDYTDSYLFVAGYHDGKLTVLRLKPDGAIGEITDEIFHKGLGSVAERNFRPHINCARMTHDNKYLLVADQGMDHVNVYRFDLMTGKVLLADIIRSELESAPRHIKISRDGRFIYIVHEWKCYIDVYSYEEKNGQPVFEKIQSIETCKCEKGSSNAASALTFSTDYKYLLSTNAGDNSAVLFRVDEQTMCWASTGYPGGISSSLT